MIPSNIDIFVSRYDPMESAIGLEINLFINSIVTFVVNLSISSKASFLEFLHAISAA